MKILVIGDSCEDIFIYGDISRIAPEAPVPVIKPNKEVGNPGMAGNVASNLRALGAEVDLITNEDPIRKIRYVDERYNQMVLRVDENDRCKPIQSLASTGKAMPHHIMKTADKYDAIIVSDYCKGFLQTYDIEQIAEMASCPVFLDTKKFLGEWCNNIDFIKINNSEHEKNFERIPKYPKLKEKLIITKGKNGCIYNEKIFPTKEVPVKDVSGAGDTFLAGLVYEYIKSNDIEKAIGFAQECTTIVVQKSGVATVK